MLPDLKSVSAGGREIAWRESGDGAAVLLLHGVGSGSASWEGQLDGLSTVYRVIAWDAPGYGGSAALDGETPVVADYAQAVTDLLDALDLDRIHLVGHSLGALIAAAFAARRAERLLTLTLADPSAGYGASDDDLRVGRLEARIRAIEELGPTGMAERRSSDVLSPNASEFAVAKVREVMSRLRPAGYKQAARMMHSTDIYVDVRAVTVPTLVMCGSADLVTPEEIARSIASEIFGSEYQTLVGLGHASYVEDPEVFNTPLCEFLGRHP